MPKATINLDSVRKDLKNAPPDGFVTLRSMSYGDVLKRRDMASKMTMEARQQRRGQPQQSARMMIDTFTRESRKFDFTKCIVDHNLTDEQDRLLDFSMDVTYDLLDPRIGEEIEHYIEEMITDQTLDDNQTSDGVPSERETFTEPSGV